MKLKIVLLTLVFVSGIISGCLGEDVDNNESELLWTGSSPTEYERNFDVGEYPIFAESGEAADIEVEECPTPKVSNTLSLLLGNPLNPL